MSNCDLLESFLAHIASLCCEHSIELECYIDRALLVHFSSTRQFNCLLKCDEVANLLVHDIADKVIVFCSWFLTMPKLPCNTNITSARIIGTQKELVAHKGCVMDSHRLRNSILVHSCLPVMHSVAAMCHEECSHGSFQDPCQTNTKGNNTKLILLHSLDGKQFIAHCNEGMPATQRLTDL
jgi:hypothetical protein